MSSDKERMLQANPCFSSNLQSFVHRRVILSAAITDSLRRVSFLLGITDAIFFVSSIAAGIAEVVGKLAGIWVDDAPGEGILEGGLIG